MSAHRSSTDQASALVVHSPTAPPETTSTGRPPGGAPRSSRRLLGGLGSHRARLPPPKPFHRRVSTGRSGIVTATPGNGPGARSGIRSRVGSSQGSGPERGPGDRRQPLGPPRVERDGVLLRLDTRKATALLALLAVTDRPRSRDALADLLWSGADPEHARGALRRTLSALRGGIGAAHLETTSDHVRLLKGPGIRIDVDRFRSCLRRGTTWQRSRSTGVTSWRASRSGTRSRSRSGRSSRARSCAGSSHGPRRPDRDARVGR